MRATAAILMLAAVSQVGANCEHAHFYSPPPIISSSGLRSDLGLDVLTPADRTLRTILLPRLVNVSRDTYSGSPVWILLDGLVADQRYETRACYAATQPTALKLGVFDLHTVKSTPELLESFVQYICLLHPEIGLDEIRGHVYSALGSDLALDDARFSMKKSSILFLRILASADYFSHYENLMANVPPTYADIILDQWIYGIVPQTALPLTGYFLAVSCLAIILGNYIAAKLQVFIRLNSDRPRKDS